MNETQLELTRLIGKKELTFGCNVSMHQHIKKDTIYLGQEDDEDSCAGNEYVYFFEDWHETPYGCGPITHSTNGYNPKFEIIGHPATLSDLHRWLNERGWIWEQRDCDIKIFADINWLIPYNSSFDLLDQSTETLKQLISIIKSYQ